MAHWLSFFLPSPFFPSFGLNTDFFFFFSDWFILHTHMSTLHIHTFSGSLEKFLTIWQHKGDISKSNTSVKLSSPCALWTEQTNPQSSPCPAIHNWLMCGTCLDTGGLWDVLWSCPLKMTFKKLGFWPLNQQESLVKSVLSQPWQKDTILDLLCLQLFLCCWLSFDC